MRTQLPVFSPGHPTRPASLSRSGRYLGAPLGLSLLGLLAGGCFVDSGYPDSGYYEESGTWYSGGGGGGGYVGGSGGGGQVHNSGGGSGSGGSSSGGSSSGGSSGGQSGGVCSAEATTGSCDGNLLSYCHEGNDYTLNCASSDKVCAWDPTNEWYDCLAPATVISDDCGAVTEEGVCDGGQLRYCSEGQLLGADCADHGGVCGWVPSKSWYDCVAVGSRKPPTPGTCSGVPAAGSCSGDALSVCTDGVVEVTDCGATGGTCVVDASGMASCAVPVPAGSCGDIDTVGECQGDTVVWCDGGALASLDCGAAGRLCGWNGTQQFYDCVDAAPVDPCGGVDEAGVCDGDVLSYCQGGELYTQVCDFGCGWSDAASYYDCAPEPVTPVDPCGGIDAIGVCDGTILSYCDADVVVVNDCLYGCGFNPVSGLSECLQAPEDPCAGVDTAGICDADLLLYCQDATLVQEPCAFGCGVSPDGVAQCLPDPAACGDVDAVGLCDGDTLWYCQDETLMSETCAFGCGYDVAAGLYSCL